jgi:PAS domain S-box-containing protein
MTDDQRVERRERNREHAKRSRIRKKFLLEALQDQLTGLRQDNTGLRGLLLVHLPGKAGDILKECMAEESFLMLDSDMRLAAEETNRRGGCGSGGGFVGFGSTGGDGVGSSSSSSGGGGRPDEGGQGTKVGLPGRCGESGASSLHGPDYRLMASLVNAQQNFAVSDPSLPDNPIVYASDGFLTLTGYSREQVLGRNCRFLQGPDTDQRMVDVIRRGVAKGEDTSVCLLNYKADGTTFWNQFFVAALKDYQGNIVNYVGVQCQVENFIEAVSTAEKNST